MQKLKNNTCIHKLIVMNYESELNLYNLLPNTWKNILNKDTINKTNILLKNEIVNSKDSYIFPFTQTDIFKIFHLTELSNIKVVILGQDPYYANKFQANGIAFSVNNGVTIPPSLRNIYKELNSNYPSNNCNDKDNDGLSKWVEQGVFLLNTSLTVKQKLPNSHVSIWNEFTNHIIDAISDNCEFVIFVAWGAFAFEKLKNIDLKKHILLSSSHPSPLSCYKTKSPFIGSKIFFKINEILKNKNLHEIIW